jgi:hypothetical protein
MRLRHLINRVLRWTDAYVFYAAFCWLDAKAPRWLVLRAHWLQRIMYAAAEFRLKERR